MVGVLEIPGERKSDLPLTLTGVAGVCVPRLCPGVEASVLGVMAASLLASMLVFIVKFFALRAILCYTCSTCTCDWYCIVVVLIVVVLY